MEEQGSTSQHERVLAALAHGSILLAAAFGVGGIVAALLIWLLQRGKSAYVAAQALQALDYQTAVLVITVVGGVGWLILWFAVAGGDIGSMPDWVVPVWIAFPIGVLGPSILYALWGAVRSLGGHDFRYAIVSKLVGRWI
jgi:hypothetical protein